MWELFMENEAPSYNDIINTPVSGIILGEITFRLSNLIIDDSKTGIQRFLTETAALVISPMHGLNRLIKGEMWKTGIKKEKPDYQFKTLAGVNSIFFDNIRANRKTYTFIGAELTYGDIMNANEHHSPFDYFMVRSELAFTDRDNISSTFASGVVWDRKIQLFDNTKDIMGIYKELDLLINTIYKFTATQLTARILSEYNIGANSRIRNNISISGVALGGINSKYASVEGKDYNLGPGAAFSLSSEYQISRTYSFFLYYKKYWIHTLSGAAGEEFAGALIAGINYHITDSFLISTNFVLFHRNAYYEKYAATSEYDSAIKTYFTLNM